VDKHGLKISVAFDVPVKGVANVQVFTTGDDYFPSDQGLADSVRTNTVIPSETDHLDIIIPVDAMPTDIQIFGNIIVNDDDGISSHVAYFLQVSGCSTTTVPSQIQHRQRF
jgi:hypothetical protein